MTNAIAPLSSLRHQLKQMLSRCSVFFDSVLLKPRTVKDTILRRDIRFQLVIVHFGWSSFISLWSLDFEDKCLLYNIFYYNIFNYNILLIYINYIIYHFFNIY